MVIIVWEWLPMRSFEVRGHWNNRSRQRKENKRDKEQTCLSLERLTWPSRCGGLVETETLLETWDQSWHNLKKRKARIKIATGGGGTRMAEKCWNYYRSRKTSLKNGERKSWAIGDSKFWLAWSGKEKDWSLLHGIIQKNCIRNCLSRVSFSCPCRMFGQRVQERWQWPCIWTMVEEEGSN